MRTIGGCIHQVLLQPDMFLHALKEPNFIYKVLILRITWNDFHIIIMEYR